MTTIAYDGTQIAVDRQLTRGNLKLPMSKFIRADDDLIIWTGTQPDALFLAEWVMAGADPSRFPERVFDADVSLIVIRPKSSPIYFCQGPIPMTVESTPFAWGSGSDFALAAMACGCGAAEAVEVAAQFDVSTGFGVDSFLIGDL